MPNFCTQCGSKLNKNALFCSSCGAKVVSADETTVENTPITPVENEPAKIEVLKNSDEAINENETSVAAAEEQKTETANETEPASNTADEAKPADESANVVNSVPETTDNVSVDNSAEVKQPSDEPTIIDKGIAFAKDKIGDGYDKFKTSPNRDKYIGFSAIGIVFIVIICLLMSIFFGGGYKSAVKDYMSAIEHGDFDDYANSLPTIIYKAILIKEYDGDEDSMENSFEENEDNLLSVIDDIDYDILDVEKLKSDDVDRLEDNLRSQYELYVDKKIKVSKAYEVDVRVIAELGKDFDANDYRSKYTIVVAKVNGDWGVINNSIGLFNSLF